MAEYKFEFVVSGKIDRIKADELGDIIEWVVNSMGLECGGDVRGTEITKWVKCIDNHSIFYPQTENLITINRIYKVEKEMLDSILILDDVGTLCAFEKNRFIEICPACGETGHEWEDCTYEPD